MIKQKKLITKNSRIMIDARVFKIEPKRGTAKHLNIIIQNLPVEHPIIIFKGIFDEKIYKSKFGKLAYIFEEQILLPLICLKHRVGELITPLHTAPILLLWCDKTLIIHDLMFLNYAKKYGIKSGMLFSSLYRSLCITLSLKSKTTKVITVSETTAKQLRFFFPELSKDKIFYITHYRTPLKKITMRKKNEGCKYFLCITGDAKHKNYDVVLRAMKRVPSEDFLLKVVGIKNINSANDNIQYYNGLNDEEIAELYLNAQALIFSSYEEGFGLPLLEAMFAKIPIICSDIKIFQEIMEDKALYFSPEDDNKLLSIILNFCEIKPKAEYSSIMKKYSQKVVARQVTDYFLSRDDFH